MVKKKYINEYTQWNSTYFIQMYKILLFFQSFKRKTSNICKIDKKQTISYFIRLWTKIQRFCLTMIAVPQINQARIAYIQDNIRTIEMKSIHILMLYWDNTLKENTKRHRHIHNKHFVHKTYKRTYKLTHENTQILQTTNLDRKKKKKNNCTTFEIRHWTKASQ